MLNLMAIDLTGFDPWPSVGGGVLGDSAAISPALSMISGDWLSVGLQVAGGLFAGNTNISGAAGGSQGGLNTSGWATGKKSSAQGSDLSNVQTLASLNNWPWWVWAAGTLIAVAVVKKAV